MSAILSFLRHNQVTIATTVSVVGIWSAVAAGSISVGDAITATVVAVTGKTLANHVTNKTGG